MHIDVAAASLLAQVIPTILIFLALEGRLKKASEEPSIMHRLHGWFRAIALFVNLSATFACLLIVMTPAEQHVGFGAVFADVIIITGVITLFFASYFMIWGLLLREVLDHH